MSERTRRLAFIGLLDLAILQLLTVWLGQRYVFAYTESFLYFGVAGLAAKALADWLYFTVAPHRRHWLYLDDYVLNDLLVHSRFALPLACGQAWLANQGPLLMPLVWSWLGYWWVSPLGGVLLWLVNRSLVEQAEEQRYRPLGTRAASLGGTGYPEPPQDQPRQPG